MSNPILTLPRHVAIVMDGNGRWAQSRNLPRLAGHQAGIKSVKKVIQAAIHHKIEILTLFVFGIENWKRPPEEVNSLMTLFLKHLDVQAPHFVKNNIRFRILGDIETMPPAFKEKITALQTLTEKNTQLTLVIAFNYSGRWDILNATRNLCLKVKSHALDPQKMTYEDLSLEMNTAFLPDPDLFIRTSGEERLSNFMLWQMAYTELYFTEVFWPDFNQEKFEEALRDFSSRQRRYGLTGAQVSKADSR